MKWLLILLGLAVVFPAGAEPAPSEEPVLSVYTVDKSENSRRAIRLGYRNFQIRVNTQKMTAQDTAIAQLIQDGFQPFFEKLNRLETFSDKKQVTLTPALQEEFEELVIELAKLLFKNQFRYTNPYFLDDQAAVQETLTIVQEAIERGTF